MRESLGNKYFVSLKLLLATASSTCELFDSAVEEIAIEIHLALPLIAAMTYNDMPVIIPLLATGYLLTIYLLLILAQRTTKSSRYLAGSLRETYVPYVKTKALPKIDEVERWSRTELPERRSTSSSNAATLTLTTSPPQKV